MVKLEYECRHCSGDMHQEDYDVYCADCGYSPDKSPRGFGRTGWEVWFDGRRRAAQEGRRVYAVGGHPAAYRGDDEYEVDRQGNFNTPPKRNAPLNK